MSALLDIKNVHMKLGKVQVLKGLELKIAAGEHTLILGPSGSGKTTLLNLAAGLIHPDSGQVCFQSEDLKHHTSLSRYRREHVGYMFQDLHLLEHMSAFDNIALIQAALNLKRTLPTPRSLLEPLGLGEQLEERVSRLSRGERQRVALARALSNRPSLLLADEPTASLDAESAKESMSHLWTLCEELECTLIVVSHDLSMRHDPRFKHTLRLSDGRAHPSEVA